jgi:hypothetical protein
MKFHQSFVKLMIVMLKLSKVVLENYGKKYMPTGMLKDGGYIGFNLAVLIVQKGNPKNNVK